MGFGSVIPVTAAVNWWFIRERSKAISRAMAGVGKGALWSPLIAIILTEFGWRVAAYSIPITLLILVVPLSRLLRPPRINQEQTTPHIAGLPSECQNTKTEHMAQEFTFMEALKTKAFWLIPLVHATNGFSTSAVYVHGIPIVQTWAFHQSSRGIFFSPME